MGSSQQASTARPHKQKKTTTAAALGATKSKVTKKTPKKPAPKVRTQEEKVKHRASSKIAHNKQDDDLEDLTDKLNAILAANKIVKVIRGKKYTRTVLRKTLKMLESKEGKAFVAMLKKAEPEDKDNNDAEEDEDTNDLKDSRIMDTIMDTIMEDADLTAPIAGHEARIGALEGNLAGFKIELTEQGAATATAMAEIKELKDVLRTSGIAIDEE